jgi:lipopolysaccharide/colanic/teichoic acid biosynthesis glycosyltransferase
MHYLDSVAERAPRAEAPPRAERSSKDLAIRALDLLIAICALIALGPFLLIVAGSIWMTDGGPPIFAHQRLGRGGRRFGCLKFRTMVIDSQQRLEALLARDPAARAEWERDQKLRNDPRVTPLGRFYRKASIDELPQLINVLLGEMSIVGPRPIVHAERVRYGRHFAAYCAVTPGITGIWQICGRNDVSYRRRVACDVLYARSRSLPLNIRIIAMTIPAVLKSEGSY